MCSELNFPDIEDLEDAELIGPAGDKDGDSLGEAEGAAEHPGERRGGDGKFCTGESFVRAVGVRS